MQPTMNLKVMSLMIGPLACFLCIVLRALAERPAKPQTTKLGAIAPTRKGKTMPNNDRCPYCGFNENIKVYQMRLGEISFCAQGDCDFVGEEAELLRDKIKDMIRNAHVEETNVIAALVSALMVAIKTHPRAEELAKHILRFELATNTSVEAPALQ
jgi:hypothetical protein